MSYLNKVKLSVIVPVYNLQNYVADCINGLVDQKTNFDYEVIVIDDCSTDNSWTILQSLKKQHPDKLFCYRNQTNLGLAKTIQKLLEKVKGEYIAYLDGDDLALPGKFQKQVDYLDNNPECSMVYHEMEVFDSDSNKNLWHYVRDYYNQQYIPTHAGIQHLIKYGCFLHICSAMIRNHKHILNTTDQSNKIILDHPWLVLNQLYLKGNIDFIDEILGRYRIHENSFGAQNRQSEQRRIQVLDEQLHVCDLAEQRGIDTSIVNQGKYHYYYATALFFLKKAEYDLFRSYITLSSDGAWFLDDKHKDIWLNSDKADFLISRYFK